MEGITLSHSALFVGAFLLLLLGGLLGLYLGQYFRGRQCPTHKQLGDIDDAGRQSGCSKQTPDRAFDSQEGPTQVLMGSLDLLSRLWQSDMSASKVVNYLSPDQMTKLLFTGSNSLRLDSDEKVADSHNRGRCSPRSSTADIFKTERISSSKQQLNQRNDTLATQPTADFLQLLSKLQTYSVNTSHPYFFNQLFGSLDPIALAAEIVALSVNTSVYTYETAPVFTLLEREVMRNIGQLVFGSSADGSGDKEFEGEGLMIPGGSLANLTAMHAARHRWKVRNGFMKKDANFRQCFIEDDNVEEEKKLDDILMVAEDLYNSPNKEGHSYFQEEEPALVAFVSSEAHYSFSKSARVLGIRDEDLIIIPTHDDGRMDVNALSKQIQELEHDLDNTSSLRPRKRRVPFFVACTAGSTVRGSFDDIASIVKVCREYESRGALSIQSKSTNYQRTIWVHVDGAWGGSAIFSSRTSVLSTTHMNEVHHADSFTFNPHKMLGAPQQTTAFIVRHRNALKNANAAGAKYLFDPRKHGAEYDLGDLSYTCGRRTDAVKLWAMWKYYGKVGLGARVDQKVDELQMFVRELRRRPAFALACKPWLFNVNFFYFPPRIREILTSRGIQSLRKDSEIEDMDISEDSYFDIPDDIAQDLANVSVSLKLRLHEAGEMIIPYQVRNL